MKICFIGDIKSIHLQRWSKYFVDAGYEVHLIDQNKYEYNTLTSHLLKNYTGIKVFDWVFRGMQVRSIIKKIKPDVIHCHAAFSSGVFGAFSGFHPLVITPWGSDVLLLPKESKVIKFLIKYSLKKADMLTCDGENTKSAMIDLGVKSEKIKIIYFGIDTKKNNPDKRNEELRRKLNISNSLSVISLRTFKPIYNIETLIKAVPLVLREMPDAKFILVGGGEQEQYLKELAKSLGVSDSIIFTGMISADEIPKYLASSDVYVSTSLSDSGLAASTGEAMACGLPVVVTDTGCNSEWVTDGKNGFVIPVKEPNLLAKKIIYLLKNKDAIKKFGDNSRGIICDRQDYYKEMEKMKKIYEELSRK